ncbi:MAG: hypothetical protein VKQ33_10630 [Candidatus Sericytochromatia bacterium]|nr:hypothetical protein [Candidatus Sericytochromatia bacterium]
MTTRPARWPEAAALALLLACLAPFAWSSTWQGDELCQLYNGVRWLSGEVYYRDFFDILGPVSPGLAALLFAVTGPSLLAARVLLVGLVALAGWLMARLVRALGGGVVAAWLAAFALALGAFRHFPFWNHHWLALPAGLAAACLAADALTSGRRRAWLFAGAATGLTGLATQTDGLVLGVVTLVGLAVRARLGVGGWRAAGREGLAYLGGGLTVLGLAAAGLALQGALADAWRCAWVWPLTHYRAPGGFNDFLVATDLGALIGPGSGPWPGRVGFLARVYHFLALYGGFFLAPLAGALFLVGLLGARGQASPSPQALRAGYVAGLVLGFTTLACRGRADLAHVAMYAPWGLVWLAAGADHAYRALRQAAPGPLAALPLAALLAFVATGGLGLVQAIRQDPGTWLAPRPPDARLRDSEVIRYIHAHTGPQDRIVSVPYGGFHYFYGRPAAADRSYHTWPAWGFTPPEAWQALRARIAAEPPALLLVLPDVPSEAGLRDNLGAPFAGMREAALVDTPSGAVRLRTWVFRPAQGPPHAR